MLPPRLLEALRSAEPPTPAVPPEREATILAAARGALEEGRERLRQRPHPHLPRMRAGGAAAALVLVRRPRRGADHLARALAGAARAAAEVRVAAQLVVTGELDVVGANPLGPIVDRHLGPEGLLVVGLLSLYFLRLSYLPEYELKVALGEPFPAYSLLDQDATPRHYDAHSARSAALYVFYRGDW